MTAGLLPSLRKVAAGIGRRMEKTEEDKISFIVP